jgi:hypothetical protein
VPSTLQKWAESLNCHRWEDFTTDTNDGQLEHRFLFNIYTDPAPVILCSGSRYGASFTTRRFDKVLAETEEFVPSRVLLTLFQRNRIFGRDNPYFAVTGKDGSFQLPNLPPGEYTVEAWHEKLGTMTQKITVAAGESKTLDFTFKAH